MSGRIALPRRCLALGVAPARRRLAASAPRHTLRLAELRQRAVLAVSGRDAQSFLQGLVTNNLGLLHAQAAERAAPRHIYAAFLNAQGRVMHDVFIFLAPDAPTDAPVYLVDHDVSASATLRKQLVRHRLRSKVAFDDAADAWRVSALWGDAAAPGLEAAADARATGLGYRLVHRPGAPPPVEADVDRVDDAHFHLHRVLHGVPEGPLDIAPGLAIPLESNMDYMGGIDFRKGCYVGQELTARTHHTGVTRKRIMPVRLFQGESVPDTLAPAGDLVPAPPTDVALPQPHVDIRPAQSTVARPRPSGKMGSSLLAVDARGGEPLAVGLALVRLEQADDAGAPSVFVTSPATGDDDASAAGGREAPAAPTWRLRAFRPAWWDARAKRDDLAAYARPTEV